jgi:hypothetical protein
MLQVRRADQVTVPAGGQHASKQIIEVAAVGLGFHRAEDADGLEEAVAVELLDLGQTERARQGGRAGVEAQVARAAVEVTLVGPFGSGWQTGGNWRKNGRGGLVAFSANSSPVVAWPLTTATGAANR